MPRISEAEALQVMLDADLEPLEPYPGSGTPWRCRCLVCDAEVQPRFGSIKYRGSSCDACATNARARINRIDSEAAASVMVAAGLEPLEPYPGSGTPWRCRCLVCDAEVQPRYSNVKRGKGCRNCANIARGKSQTVPSENAIAVMVAAGLEPLEPYPGSVTPWRCRCLTCGNEVTPRYSAVQRGHRCRNCANAARRIDPSEAHQMMLEAGLEPLEPYPKANVPWRCRCLTCGNEVTPHYSAVQRGHRCNFCGPSAPNDPDKAAEVMRLAGLEPLEPYPGTRTPWRCRCLKCGTEVAPQYKQVMRGSGCRSCADTGFDPAAPACVYLIQHPELPAVKVGLSGKREKGTRRGRYGRLETHQGRGWTVHGMWEFSAGAHAEEIESAVLAWWREDLGAPLALGADQIPQGGETETAWLTDVDIDETVTFIDRLVAAD